MRRTMIALPTGTNPPRFCYSSLLIAPPAIASSLAGSGPSDNRFAQSFHQPFQVRHAFAECTDLTNLPGRGLTRVPDRSPQHDTPVMAVPHGRRFNRWRRSTGY